MRRTQLISLVTIIMFLLLSNQPSGIGKAVDSEISDLYLPMVLKNYPPPPPIFGVETHLLDSFRISKAQAANMYWLRNQAFSWRDIEPVRTTPNPTYNWAVVNESGLQEASANGLNLIATVLFTPSWAQKYPGVSCGPIAEHALDEFAQFMHALVLRYGVPPYNIKYWEIGNEPDVDPDLVPPDSIFGCWGDADDPYYGGGYYAEMLKRAYPAVKAANPQAKIVLGGLLLDCDPTHPPPGKDCKPARFLEGILLNQGARFLDIVSFHGYAFYISGEIVDEQFVSWAYRGGIAEGKTSFLREVMSSYGISLPILHTEGGLLCLSAQCPTDFYQAQAEYVIWLYVRDWANRLYGTAWYSLEGPGWREGGLLNGSEEKPAYLALEFIAHELEQAEFIRPITQYPGLRGYEFYQTGKYIWVLWSPQRTNNLITLPGDVTKVYNLYGSDITPGTNQIVVNSPVYVERIP